MAGLLFLVGASPQYGYNFFFRAAGRVIIADNITAEKYPEVIDGGNPSRYI